MLRMLFGATVLLLTGCTIAPNSSGVFEARPGIFTVTSNAEFGGVASAKGDAMERATKACSARGKPLYVIDEQTSGVGNTGSSQLTFRCQ